LFYSALFFNTAAAMSLKKIRIYNYFVTSWLITFFYIKKMTNIYTFAFTSFLI
jgi:hypothetical protein